MDMTLNDRIRELEQKVAMLKSIIDNLLRDESDKDLQPYSNINSPAKLENSDSVLIDGLWRHYAIYKDEEEED